MIPFFQLEFDALQVLYNMFGEIPPNGDFGDFWWLFWLFSLLGSAGGPAKNWCQIFAWVMTDPKKHILAMVFLVLGQSGPQNLVSLLQHIPKANESVEPTANICLTDRD